MRGQPSESAFLSFGAGGRGPGGLGRPRGLGKGVPWGQQGAGGKPAASAGGRGGRRGPAGGCGPAPLTQLQAGALQPVGSLRSWEPRWL